MEGYAYRLSQLLLEQLVSALLNLQRLSRSFHLLPQNLLGLSQDHLLRRDEPFNFGSESEVLRSEKTENGQLEKWKEESREELT